MDKKNCVTCRRELDIEMFKKNDWGRRYRVCDQCKNPETYNSKVCTRCFEDKPLTEFYKRNDGKYKDKYRANCNPCSNAYIREYQIKNDYGISMEEYRELLETQGHKCLLCGSTKKLCIDHDHASGAVRAILCDRCNIGLGCFGDNPELLEKAAEYLREVSNAILL